MYVNDINPSDSSCFTKCNNKFITDFEFSFNISASDFYDFPLHPLILEHSSYLLFCKLATEKTRCYIDKCNDKSADAVFSPSNFICDFRRSLYQEARPCLAEAEPITFLKCDQQCHDSLRNRRTIGNNSLYKMGEVERYEEALSTLCAFQSCYLDCSLPLISEVCSSNGATRASNLLSTFVQWHANDIYEWHVVSDRLQRLPLSCARLSDNKAESIVQIMQNVKKV
ncbi:unnamed protein product, partial [Mesorhabditis belari]|uniref:Chondroitin proteoglycan 4 domain-containing protein n=1 Tax=Mesorhabditis belari TaxID=2138241 RepID=A0AAF3FCE2_9BILA